MQQEVKSLAEVVGENVKRLRGEKSMETVASAAQAFGLNWSAGSVSAIENGNFKVTIETLMALTSILNNEDNWIRGEDDVEAYALGPKLEELFKTDSPIAVGKGSVTTHSAILKWLHGSQLETRLAPEMLEKAKEMIAISSSRLKSLNLPEGTTFGDLRTKYRNPTAGEERAAKRAGVDVIELLAWSDSLWAMRFEERRDKLAGEGSTPQKKGRVTRNLISDIQAAMDADGKH